MVADVLRVTRKGIREKYCISYGTGRWEGGWCHPEGQEMRGLSRERAGCAHWKSLHTALCTEHTRTSCSLGSVLSPRDKPSSISKIMFKNRNDPICIRPCGFHEALPPVTVHLLIPQEEGVAAVAGAQSRIGNQLSPISILGNRTNSFAEPRPGRRRASCPSHPWPLPRSFS